MPTQTHFVIFGSDSRYSITECGIHGVKQAFMAGGTVSGDHSVIQKLSQIKPEDVSIERYVENHAGHLIYGD